MNNQIHAQIKPASKSMQISKQRTNGFRFKSKVFVVKDIRQHSQKDVKQITISPLRHLSTDISKSSDIAIIKQQIQKLRTQSPQLNYCPQDRNLVFFKGQPKSKKRDDLVKIVMNKLKRQKSKEYARKLKKNDVLLPKLDLSGKSLLQTPSSIKYAPYVITKIPELDVNKAHWPQDSIVQKKQVQPTTKKPYVFKSQLCHNKYNQSISGWHKNNSPEQEHCLFIDN